MQAKEILQQFLDEVGNAVMRDLFEDYSAHVHLPLSILTSAANLSVETQEDLRDGFDDFTEMLRSRGCTDMLRIVMDAWFEGPETIVGIYETNLIDGTQHVVPQFYSKMWLGRFDGVWQTTKIHNTTQDQRWPILLTQVPSVTWPPKELIQ